MPITRNMGLYGLPSYNQAQKIVAKFGGEVAMAKLLGISRISVYRWQYRWPYGSDGLIPSQRVNAINELARVQGVLLREEDWMPEAIRYDDATKEHREILKEAVANRIKAGRKRAPTPDNQPSTESSQ